MEPTPFVYSPRWKSINKLSRSAARQALFRTSAANLRGRTGHVSSTCQDREGAGSAEVHGREPIFHAAAGAKDGDSEFGDAVEDANAIAPSDAVAFSLLQEQFNGA